MYYDLYYIIEGITYSFEYHLVLVERVLSLEELFSLLKGYALKLTEEESDLLKSNDFKIVNSKDELVSTKENVSIYPEMLVFN